MSSFHSISFRTKDTKRPLSSLKASSLRSSSKDRGYVAGELGVPFGDTAIAALGRPADKAGRSKIYECAAAYPAKTSKRLVECEVRDV